MGDAHDDTSARNPGGVRRSSASSSVPEPVDSRSARGESQATSCPLSSRITLSASCSTSARVCEANRTVVP